ncbi:hypothetical protein FJR48_04240 [Sulfurimonas lithotrophica]|uniref:Uncharacterized protein n=1 Tax=Sulfurimonas lithotrophica TaxID=2590022 RepID=A0A5P8NZU7_9BACT|nr:hypothetical protein [Sulfurimonas lithotrophica]QFR48972.1 hypothetical protein FJR48_04240 [Sulfurimonas lithotrophica]
MRVLFILLTLISLSFSKQQVFMLDEYDKEIELEAKIISKIATATLNNKIKIYIPNISKHEQEIYSKYFDLSEDCKYADFIFDKKGSLANSCKNSTKLFFTNNYKKLVSDSRYFGAFFWNKSRPNIVFIKKRLQKNNIKLSKEYEQFIEDIYE